MACGSCGGNRSGVRVELTAPSLRPRSVRPVPRPIPVSRKLMPNTVRLRPANEDNRN